MVLCVNVCEYERRKRMCLAEFSEGRGDIELVLPQHLFIPSSDQRLVSQVTASLPSTHFSTDIAYVKRYFDLPCERENFESTCIPCFTYMPTGIAALSEASVWMYSEVPP